MRPAPGPELENFEPALSGRPRAHDMADAPDTVIVIDDDRDVRESLGRLLRSVRPEARLYSSVAEFLGAKKPDGPTCLVLDVRLPGLSGMDLQRELAAANNPIPIIFITGHGDIPMSVRAMKAGAAEFLTKSASDAASILRMTWPR